MNEFNELEELIINRPEALFLLYHLYYNGNDTDMPQHIIKRKEEVMWLQGQGLIEPLSSKKMHLIQNKLTKLGRNICVSLVDQRILPIFDQIALSSIEDFRTGFYNKLSELRKQNQYGNSKIFPLISPNIKVGLPFFINKINIENLELKQISQIDSFEKWSFCMKFTCPRCRRIQEVKFEINYDSNKRPSLEKIICPNCQLELRLCQYFNCFYST